MNAFFCILCVHKLKAAASQIQEKMQKVCFDMTGLKMSCVSKLIIGLHIIFHVHFAKYCHNIL